MRESSWRTLTNLRLGCIAVFNMKKKLYRDKDKLFRAYKELGSTRRAGKFFGVSNKTIIYWMKKYDIPRIPRMELHNNSSGWGRRAELYVAGFSYFVENFRDFGEFDKSSFDGIWFTERVNIKCTHSRKRYIFGVKKNRHDVSHYICCVYNDDKDPLIPIAIFVIPAKVAPHTSITVSLNPNSKYARYMLKEGVDFDVKEAKKYNKNFKKKYSYLLGK